MEFQESFNLSINKPKVNIMTNTILESNNNVFLKPSVNGDGYKGIHTKTSWFSKAGFLFEAGFTMNQACESVPVNVEYSGKNYQISPDILFQAALYEGITNNRLSELLDCYSKGFVGKNQVRMSEKDNQEKNPFERATKLLTANEYRTHVISSMVENPEVQAKLVDFATTNIPESMTKAQIVELVHSIQELLFPESKKEVYFEMIKKEEAEAAKWKVLTEAGFSDFAKTASGYFASIGLAQAETGVKELEKAGYKLSGSPTVNPDMTLRVFFVEGTVEPLEV